tara:strand:- start:22923 stop:23684 length:762 start_codon:yes stop_codon:yes gene_type:complete
MIKKRILGSVVIRDNYAVQSFKFKKYLPIGKPEIVVENLSWWGVDEILLLDINSKKKNKEVNLEVLKKICKKNLSTPLIYAGRIYNSNDAIKLINCGVERIALGSIIFENVYQIKEISQKLGSQSIIIILNFVFKNNKLYLLDHRNNNLELYSKIEDKLRIIQKYFSEILVIDVENQGSNGKFNLKILKNINLQKKLILCGGMFNYKKITKMLKNNRISAISIGNQLNFKEHAYQELKNKIKSKYLRPALYNK